MNKATTVLAGVGLVLSSAALALGQEPTTTPTTPNTTIVTQTPTTVTKTVQNPDGTFTVIEYPAKKEVTVMLNPVTIKDAKGVATILRDDTGTAIKLNLTGVPADVTALNLYAVDEAGTVTSLGPVTIASGAGTFTTTTPLNKFMLIASPEANLATYDPTTKIFFRSAVPEGFAVIPYTIKPVGEKVAATTTAVVTPATTTAVVTPATTTAVVTPATTTAVATPAATTVVATPATTTAATTPATTYTVPMLNIPAYKKGDDTKMKINFTGAMTGARANVFITPRKDGPTEVKLRFHELKDAPAGQVFLLWAVSPDNQFVKLGQVVNTPGRNEAEIKSETALKDFGLLITMEDATAASANPLGPSIGIVEITK